MALDLVNSEGDSELTAFAVETTLADQIAFNRYLWTTPAWRQQQAQMAITVVTLAPLVALALAFALIWAVPVGCDLDTALGTDSRGLFFAKVLGGVLAAAAGAASALWAWRRWFIDRAVRAVLLRRPHIKPDDPDLRETTRVAFHARSYRASGPTAAYAYTWTYTKRFDETADHFFIMVEPMFGFIVPKRDLPPETLLTIREIAKQVHEP